MKTLNDKVLLLRHRQPNPAGRRGTSMLELVVGTVLIGIFLASTVPMLRWVHISSRFNEEHRIATQELANQMEQLAALPPGELTDDYLATLQPSAATHSALPDAHLTVASSLADADTQKITFELSWNGDLSRQIAPVRLTAWFPVPAAAQAPAISQLD